MTYFWPIIPNVACTEVQKLMISMLTFYAFASKHQLFLFCDILKLLHSAVLHCNIYVCLKSLFNTQELFDFIPQS